MGSLSETFDLINLGQVYATQGPYLDPVKDETRQVKTILIPYSRPKPRK